jgi:hypothetical protein
VTPDPLPPIPKDGILTWAAERVVIIGNQVYDCCQYGIDSIATAGVCIAHNIVRGNGGAIKVEGKGTCSNRDNLAL